MVRLSVHDQFLFSLLVFLYWLLLSPSILSVLSLIISSRIPLFVCMFLRHLLGHLTRLCVRSLFLFCSFVCFSLLISPLFFYAFHSFSDCSRMYVSQQSNRAFGFYLFARKQ